MILNPIGNLNLGRLPVSNKFLQEIHFFYRKYNFYRIFSWKIISPVGFIILPKIFIFEGKYLTRQVSHTKSGYILSKQRFFIWYLQIFTKLPYFLFLFSLCTSNTNTVLNFSDTFIVFYEHLVHFISFCL